VNLKQNNMIKKIIYASICIFILSSCGSTKVLPTTGEVKKSSETVGVLVLNAKGYGTSQSEALDHAKEQAFTNLFFRGVSNTSYAKAMIGNEEESKKAHKRFFKEFFKNKGFNKFISNTDITKAYNKKTKSIECNISININSLRSNLEENGVISGFKF
tara:strand:- start:1330 stop:1803 length:474 start_codon:yes stop_codon:yes gene_type:complete